VHAEESGNAGKPKNSFHHCSLLSENKEKNGGKKKRMGIGPVFNGMG